ncbi:hypothetical protein BaRGS_00039318 [Batillaria attramentaria]|uniref:Uncharacterized protein n=1 Tax=Batillaria attramentaria TaxID=370345 RepID=A0ABD0J442_9CAEN
MVNEVTEAVCVFVVYTCITGVDTIKNSIYGAVCVCGLVHFLRPGTLLEAWNWPGTLLEAWNWPGTLLEAWNWPGTLLEAWNWPGTLLEAWNTSCV